MLLSSGFAPAMRFTIERVAPFPTLTVLPATFEPRELASAAVPTCSTPALTVVPPA